jgi:acetyl-CoA decarbonylase/synthase complex subunit gamma
VKFGFNDRIKLIPNDFMQGKFYLLGAILILFLISGLNNKGLSYHNFPGESSSSILMAILAYFSGIVITPMFLPYFPGRHFSLKGFFSGMLVFLGYLVFSSRHNLLITLSWFFIIGAISSFVAMNFTGSSTFTSLSGVKKEMKLFVPLQISFAVIGIILQVIGKLL